LLADGLAPRGAAALLSGLPGAYLPFERGLVALVVALAPVGLLLGLLFQWAAKLLVAAGGTLAEAYAIESVGGVMGGLAATLGLAWGLDAVSLALLCSLAAVGAAGLCLRGSRRGVRAALGLLALAGLALLVRAPEIDRHMTRWNHLALVESRDSPYARITLTRRADQTAIFVNDALAFETEGTEAESFVHPVLLQHPSPSSVLVLGGCAEGIVAEVLRHRPRSVDCVELDPVLLGLALRHLPAPLARPLGSPGVRLVRADPRRFLHEAQRYDAILVGMPDPDSGQANRFYTREFFEQCAKRLNAPGILGLRLRSAEDFGACRSRAGWRASGARSNRLSGTCSSCQDRRAWWWLRARTCCVIRRCWPPACIPGASTVVSSGLAIWSTSTPTLGWRLSRNASARSWRPRTPTAGRSATATPPSSGSPGSFRDWLTRPRPLSRARVLSPVRVRSRDSPRSSRCCSPGARRRGVEWGWWGSPGSSGWWRRVS
jgi:hypothetical protein